MNKVFRLEVNDDTTARTKGVAQLKVPRSSSIEMAMASSVGHSDMTRPLGGSMLSCKFGLVYVLLAIMVCISDNSSSTTPARCRRAVRSSVAS